MSKTLTALAAVLCCAAPAAWAQVSSFDATTNLLMIPSVSVGASSFINVSLKNRGDYVFELQDATAQSPAAPGVTSYDAVSGVLTLPAVKVGTSTYVDVKLLNTGNFVFTLQAATALPQATIDEALALVTTLDARWATGVPATAELRTSLLDGCYLHDGRSKAWLIADTDANLAAYALRDAYQVGRRSSNLQVLAVRNVNNADGSTRREIDVQYDISYSDGTSTSQTKSTLVSGSTNGTPRCTTPQNLAALRYLGNQMIVQASVRANNWRDERYNISNGAPASPAVNYRREVQFQITDPLGHAKYVIVTGRGPTNTIAGQVHPFSMKFLSPQLLKSAPELQGKQGNFLNWLADDSFRNCRMADGSVPVVMVVDCVANGATTNVWGWTTSTPDAAADQGFVAQDWVAGTSYRFDVYDDDGWKTVNGHANRMPVATYHAMLDRLPYTFVAMTNKYPLIYLGGMSSAQAAANAVSATPAPLSLSWTQPGAQADGRKLHLFQVWEFHQGAKASNLGTTFNPAYRSIVRAYPGTTAVSTTSFPVTAKLPDQKSKTYTEFNLFFAEPGTFNSIQSRISLQ